MIVLVFMFEEMVNLQGVSQETLTLIYLVLVWTLFWKGMALWKSAKRDQLAWFIVILILNTFGILPLLYVLFFRDKKKEEKSEKKIVKKKKSSKK